MQREEHKDGTMLVLTHEAPARSSTGYHLDDLVLSVSREDFGLEVSLHRDSGMMSEDGSACWENLTPEQAKAMLFAMRDMVDEALAFLA